MSYRALPDPPPIPDKPAHYRSDSEIGYYEAQYIASYEAKYGASQRDATYVNGDHGGYGPYEGFTRIPAQSDGHSLDVAAQESYRPLPVPPMDGTYPLAVEPQPQPYDPVYSQSTYDHANDDPYHFHDMQENLPPRPLPKPPQYADTYADLYPYDATCAGPYQSAYSEPRQPPYPETYHERYHDLPQPPPHLDIPSQADYKPEYWEPHHEARQWSREVEDLDIVYGESQVYDGTAAYDYDYGGHQRSALEQEQENGDAGWYGEQDGYVHVQEEPAFHPDYYDVGESKHSHKSWSSSLPPHLSHQQSSSFSPTVENDDLRRLNSLHRSVRPPPPDVSLCDQPWSRSQIFDWLLNSDIHSDRAVIRALRSLVIHVLPQLPKEEMKLLSKNIFRSYIKADEIQLLDARTGDIAFVKEAGQGVFPMLLDCPRRRACYSPRCPHRPSAQLQRLRSPPGADVRDWMQAWSLAKESPLIAVLEPQAIQQQYAIHELIYTETEYLASLKTYDELFTRSLVETGAADQKLVETVFGNISEVIALAEYLEPRLADRQARHGPCIEHVADIFLAWTSRATDAYVRYATGLRYGERMMRQRSLSDLRIKSWLTKCEADPRAAKLSFFSYQGLPTRRLQRYVLLLSEVLKKTSPQADEYDELERAIASLKAVCVRCDEQVDLANRRISLLDLEQSLLWKVPRRELQLSAPDRHIAMRGELQRKSDSQLEWQTRDVVLLDNFLLCLKSSKDTGQLVISISPIPVDYLVVEASAEVLLKSSSSRFAGTFTHTVGSGTELRRLNTNSSATTEAPSPRKEELYPFTLKHAGRHDKHDGDEVLILYAETAEARDAWIAAIRQVKSARYAKIASAAPFEVKVHAVSTTHSSYLSQPRKQPLEPHDAVSAAVLYAEVPASVMLQPNCATPLADGALLLGTDNGVFKQTQDGSWKAILHLRAVSQIAALTAFEVLLVLADRILYAFSLSDLRAPPQKLSSREVSFFEVGTSKGRALVIFKQTKSGNSVFHALEPVTRTHKAKGDFFRLFDQFFVPTECHGLQFLKSTLCVTCSRGFEILSLDAKQPLSIPTADAATEATESARLVELRRRLAMARPLGAYRIREGEFLACYDTIAVTLDKYGSLVDGRTTDAVPLVWQVRARKAALVRGEYAVACGTEALEAWQVEKRSLRQVCTGKDMRMLEVSGGGGGGDSTDGPPLLFSMAHPTMPRHTVVFEMRRR